MARAIEIGLNAVIVAVTDEEPRILTLERSEPGNRETPTTTRRPSPSTVPPRRIADGAPRFLDALPFGPLDPEAHRTLELGLRSWVREQTGIELGYVEQLYTFGNRDREPPGDDASHRVISVAYLALVREAQVAGDLGARWRDWYGFFPWEDWRAGRPPLIQRVIVPALRAWVAEAGEAQARRRRQERVDIAFGVGGSPWDGERVLDRYELLYEGGLAYEARRDRRAAASRPRAVSAGGAGSRDAGLPPLGRPMAADHRRILASALGRLRGKLKYRPVVFELLPPTFTLLQLQRLVESLAGVRLHKQNFRRLVEKGGLVEGTKRLLAHTGGRPAELFGFRREALRERPAPGLGLPGLRP